jgi:hypothetical protein
MTFQVFPLRIHNILASCRKTLSGRRPVQYPHKKLHLAPARHIPSSRQRRNDRPLIPQYPQPTQFTQLDPSPSLLHSTPAAPTATSLGPHRRCALRAPPRGPRAARHRATLRRAPVMAHRLPTEREPHIALRHLTRRRCQVPPYTNDWPTGPQLPNSQDIKPAPPPVMYWNKTPVWGVLPTDGFHAHTVTLADNVAWIFGGFQRPAWSRPHEV